MFKKEPINPAGIRRFAQLRGAAQVKFKCGGAEESLRRLLFKYLSRADRRNCILVAWREHRFGTLGHGPCRRYSGLSGDYEVDDLPAEVQRCIQLGLTLFESTCSGFASSKLVKHMLRCGLDLVECDIQNCYPTLVHRRHPEEPDVEEYVKRRDQYITEAVGGNNAFRGDAKQLYISVFFGSEDGGLADRDWVDKTGLAVPPFVAVSMYKNYFIIDTFS